jgi:hypothetical protein
MLTTKKICARSIFLLLLSGMIILSIFEIIISIKIMKVSDNHFNGAIYSGCACLFSGFLGLLSMFSFSKQRFIFFSFVICNALSFIIAIIGTSLTSQYSIALKSLGGCAFYEPDSNGCGSGVNNLNCIGDDHADDFSENCALNAVNLNTATTNVVNFPKPDRSECYCVYSSLLSQCANIDGIPSCYDLLTTLPRLYTIAFAYVFPLIGFTALLFCYRTTQFLEADISPADQSEILIVTPEGVIIGTNQEALHPPPSSDIEGGGVVGGREVVESSSLSSNSTPSVMFLSETIAKQYFVETTATYRHTGYTYDPSTQERRPIQQARSIDEEGVEFSNMNNNNDTTTTITNNNNNNSQSRTSSLSSWWFRSSSKQQQQRPFSSSSSVVIPSSSSSAIPIEIIPRLLSTTTMIIATPPITPQSPSSSSSSSTNHSPTLRNNQSQYNNQISASSNQSSSSSLVLIDEEQEQDEEEKEQQEEKERHEIEEKSSDENPSSNNHNHQVEEDDDDDDVEEGSYTYRPRGYSRVHLIPNSTTTQLVDDDDDDDDDVGQDEHHDH